MTTYQDDSTAVKTETLEERIANAHYEARSVIQWISLPSVAARYELLDVEYLVSILSVCIDSISPEEAIIDIGLIIDYVKSQIVEQGV